MRSNNRSPPTLTLIDRFLATEGLLGKFSNARVQRLNRPTFDHYPILLSMGCSKWGPSPFRFENMWLNHYEFLLMVEYWWKNTPLHGWPGHDFINKLKRLKGVLKKWNKEVFGCLSTKGTKLLTEIALLDQIVETGSITLVQHTQKKLMKAELISLAVNEEQSWRQKCKKRWLEEGDMNSKFFPRTMAIKKQKSTIMKILSTQGISLVNEEEIVSEFVSFYTSLYTKDIALCEFPHGLNWSSIDQQQAASFEVVFTEEEVGKAIQHLGSNKTLGPDGFTSKFFQKCWNLMRADIMRVFHDFFETELLMAT